MNDRRPPESTLFPAEVHPRLEALSQSAAVSEKSASEALARWRRERPAMLNDTRKLMAAAFLLLAPQQDEGG